MENVKSNELSFVFSKIVSKGLCCDKVWGISILGYCTVLGAVYMEGGRFSHQEEARRRKNFSLGLHAEIVVRAVNRREGIKEQR